MMDKEEWSAAAQSFESSLMILRKDKNGWVIGFSVHPDEAPRDLLDAPLGTRFQAVLFEIGDDEKPVGMVWFALADGDSCDAWRRRLPPVNREFVRERSALEALAAVLKRLSGLRSADRASLPTN